MNTRPLDKVPFDSVSEACRQIRQGRIVVVVDDKERENEGNLVCAAERVTPELVDFLLRHGRGLLCVTVGRDLVERLGLPTLVPPEPGGEFTRPTLVGLLDHRESGSGVSAESRARTIRALVDGQSRAEDFVQPGHVPVFAARDGGVLRRAGHAEAAVDLMRLADVQPAAVVCEILARDGHGMASGSELHRLAAEHGLAVVSIEELIQHRIAREKLVRREVETRLPTRHGSMKLIAYSVRFDDHSPVAIVVGDLQAVPAPLVRIHRSCFGIDVLAALRRDGRSPFHCALEQIRREGAGVLVFLGHDSRGLADRLRRLAAASGRGIAAAQEECRASGEGDMRDHMTSLQILKDLGLNRVRLLTNRPEHVHHFAWSAVGIQVEPVPMWCLRRSQTECLGELLTLNVVRAPDETSGN